jgi:hypothetical protein
LFQNRLLESSYTGSPGVPLLTQNKANVEEFYNNMQDQGTGFRYLKDLDADLLASATRLIRFINKEYKLDGE